MPLNDDDRDMHIEWAASDPVTEEEKEINKKVCEMQGNSNNFVEVLEFDTKKCEKVN
jgi:endonuclease I